MKAEINEIENVLTVYQTNENPGSGGGGKKIKLANFIKKEKKKHQYTK